MQRIEGRGASKGHLLAVLRNVGLTGAHLKSYGDELGSPEVIDTNRETPVKYFKEIKGCSSEKVMQPTAQLKCLYTNVHSMGKKQEELEATMQKIMT
ncbi:hypothetical protein AV530_014103 [Patagioenas fasciata monilis]|uniref:Uncharacterized protein n=1 Tax=Patagioenas fasciata monilis TaxID=372326 RepID=A0A1V4KD50_PATFA|nr:hypothetical protein AV530_014103 [Patagioenas fasciata monilis]